MTAPALSLTLSAAALLLTAAVTSRAPAAFAQIPHPQTIQLEPVTVEGSGREGSEQAGYRVDTVRHVGPWGAKDVLDTPYTITTASSALMQNILASTQDDLWRLNPLVGSSKLPVTYGGNPWIITRGFSVLFSDRLNGLRLPYTPVAMVETLDRVELFSGLSGFLNGGSSGGRVGGSVNYVSKRPTREPLTQLAAGSYEGRSVFGHLDVSRRLDVQGKAGARFNLVHQDGDSAISDQRITRHAGSAALDWQLAPHLLVQLNAELFHYRLKGVAPLWFLGAGVTQLPSAPDPAKLWSQPWAFAQRDGGNVGANVTYELNESIQLRGAVLYGEQKMRSIYARNTLDAGGGYAQILLPFAKTREYGGGSSLFADGSFATGPIRHKLTLGYRYFLGRTSAPQDYFTSSTSAIMGDLSSPMHVPQGSVVYAGTSGTLPVYLQQTATQQSWIIGDTLTFTGQWSMLVGLNRLNVVTHNFNADGSTLNRYDKTKTTPTITLMFKPNEQVLTYAGYMQALEPGAIVGPGYTNSSTVLPPLSSKQVEIGMKAQVGQILVTGALFQIEKGNQYSNGALPLPTFVQDGKQVNKGVEFTATGKLLPRLTVVGGVTLLQPEIKKTNTPALTGKDPIGIARTTAKTYLEYQPPGLDDWTLTGGVFYNGKVYQDALNTTQLPSFTTVDLGLRYAAKIGTTRVTFRLNAVNVFARRYWTSNTFANQNHLGEPRKLSASATMAF